MAYKVKCVDTGAPSISNIAYRAPNGKYWSSEAAYQQYCKQREWYCKSIDILAEELGYNGDFIPTLMMKNMKRFEKLGYDAVYDTIIKKRDAIAWAIRNKDFSSEYNKIRYIFAIIDHHIMDVYEAKKHDRERERINEKMVIPKDDKIKNNKQETHDISRFLTEG